MLSRFSLLNSLYIRIFLVVMGGVILALFLGHQIHEWERARQIELIASKRAAHHIQDVAILLSVVPPTERTQLLKALPQEVWSFDAHQNLAPPVGFPNPKLATDINTALKGYASVEESWTDPSNECLLDRHCKVGLGVQLRFKDAQKLTLIYRVSLDTIHPMGSWHLIKYRYLPFVVLMGLASLWVVKMTLRPINRMTRALEGFGHDISQPALEVDGPVELHRAFVTFNRMQEQIRSFMLDRTELLAAITHDLKTPLTRIRLRLEDVQPLETRSKLIEDLSLMQLMIDEGLELSKSLHSSGPRNEIELTCLLQSICDDYSDEGRDVWLDVGSSIRKRIVSGQVIALRRVFENLIENALKYGGAARVSFSDDVEVIRVTVRDFGPGIPESFMESVVKPFVRLDSSRSRDTGGTGLGLAIASNLIRSQDGCLSLRNHQEAGLEVCVTLPRSKKSYG